MARISIYIGRHLCTAPRPCKEADALTAAGHTVTVSGLWFDTNLIARDRALLAEREWKFSPYANCRPGAPGSRWRWWRVRANQRLAREFFSRTRVVTADLFGYGTSWLLAHARQYRADLAIFHSEGGLYAARRLHRSGRRVGMDFEDWFSRDFPSSRQSGRAIAALAKLEAAALHYGPYVLATSRAMSAALAEAYHGPPPAVIYNSFPIAHAPCSPAERPHDAAHPISLHWFSQTLGPGRGLETLFAVLPSLSVAWQLVLRADDPGNYSAQLLALLPTALHSRVRFLPTVFNQELPARIAEHDIGLALEVSDIPNRNLTVTNKLFQYLQAGLAVVASNTAGHTEILGQTNGAGEIYSAGDVASLRTALEKLCSNPQRLAAAKLAARHAAETLFAHERQAPLYAELVARALKAN